MKHTKKREHPPVNFGGLVDQFCQSIANLAPIVTSPAELNIIADIHTAVRAATTDPQAAYRGMTGVYNHFGFMTNDEFSAFTSPHNYAAKLLMVHFFLVEYVLGMSNVSEVHFPSFEKRRAMALGWIDGVITSLPNEYKTYAQWALPFARTVPGMHEQLRRNKNNRTSNSNSNSDDNGNIKAADDSEWADYVWEGDVVLSQDGRLITVGKADMSSDLFTYRSSDSEVRSWYERNS